MDKNQVVVSIDENNRIAMVSWYKIAPEGALIVDRNMLPEGNLTDYLYVDGAFIHDPLPELEPEAPVPSTEDRITELESDKKLMDAQIQALSARNDFLEDCIAEMATIIYA